MSGPAACRSVVLPLEHLAVLDLYLWLGHEGAVSDVLEVHQSTVSRQVRSALKLFKLKLKLSRADGSMQLGGDASLLMAERAVHQQARLRGRAPLRIDATYASGPWFLASPPRVGLWAALICPVFSARCSCWRSG